MGAGNETQTVGELKLRRDDLVEAIQGIDGQLAQRDRRNPETQERLTNKEFHTWRGKAVTARKHLLDDLRLVKMEINEREQSEFARIKQEEHERMLRIEAKLDMLLERLQ